MKRKIKCKVNGEQVETEAAVTLTLLDFIREELHLTGTKKGCGNGECGACTVLMDDQPVRSCLILAVESDGAALRTIEGLSDGQRLHTIQQAFIDADAIQCGYCSPGFLMAAAALLSRHPQPTQEQIEDALGGHLCRCTGYEAIFRAIRLAAERIAHPD